jgi:hypothetical protein
MKELKMQQSRKKNQTEKKIENGKIQWQIRSDCTRVMADRREKEAAKQHQVDSKNSGRGRSEECVLFIMLIMCLKISYNIRLKISSTSRTKNHRK